MHHLVEAGSGMHHLVEAGWHMHHLVEAGSGVVHPETVDKSLVEVVEPFYLV